MKLMYSKCSKILNSFLFLFSMKVLVINLSGLRLTQTAGQNSNGEDPDYHLCSEQGRP